MKKIGIIAKPFGSEVKKIIEELLLWLKEKEKEVYLDPETAASFSDRPHFFKIPFIPQQMELVIVLGGDGTLLSVARLIEGNNVPILGVNLGGLGFLTEINMEDLYPTLEKIFQNEFLVDERIMLKTSVDRQGKKIAHSHVLNDVIINKGALAKMIKLEIYSNGHFLSSLRGDGLIVSSPTGSTAYSLSAGGPILYPSVDALILTPICPHTLTQRPIVIPSEMKLEIILKSKEEGAMVTFDGQVGFSLRLEDQIHIEKSEAKTQLIRSPGLSYFDVLRNKLHWGEGKNR
ncbi:MAG: NAD(+)/NADH kinase [Nitrospirae bacterium]|nr:NAD(+)/NADH kinase [Nitrospirota bacterium]